MRNRSHARAALLTGVAGFLAIQAGLTVLLAGRLSWLRSPDYGHKAARLRQAIQTAERRQTVVMLGSSRTVHALSGSAIEPLLERALGHRVLVYNFGIPASAPVTNLLHLRRLLAEGIRPDLMLIEVMPPFLLTRGKRPLQSDSWLSRLLPCYHFRIPLVTSSLPALLRASERSKVLADDARGWIALEVLGLAGKRPLALQHARAEYRSLLRKRTLGGANVEALEHMLRLCRREQIRAALVLMPEGPLFRSWYPAHVLHEIRHLLDGLSRAYATPIIDAREWIANEDAFLDSHHLLPSGATAFSRRLGERVLPLLRHESRASDPRSDL